MSTAPRGRRAHRLRWTIIILAVAFVLAGTTTAWLYLSTRPQPYRPGEDHRNITRNLSGKISEDAPTPALHDATAEAGLDGFVQFAGARSSQLPEDMGSGAAGGDYDNDGDEDLLLVAGGGSLDAARDRYAPTLLYENLGDGTFRRNADFPETRVVGMGAAWGDYDADGWQDLIVTTYGGLILFHNDVGTLVRDEGFPDLPGYWSGASWSDYDRDGDLDLYVCGYVRFVPRDADRARATLQYGRSVPYTLNPASYEPERNLLFRNDGDRSFTEVGALLGVDNLRGRSLGALWHDFDDDGWPDLYVANDISDNVLFHNSHGSFEEISHSAWVADYRGAMGLAAADFDRDGDDDLFVSHWVAQENALYDSQLVQLAARREETAATPSSVPLRFVGWGAEFLDLDADGWLDLPVANGSTFETEDSPPRLRPQASFLFWSRQGKQLHDLAPLNDALAAPHVSRGLAVSDYDEDGDLDILIVDNGEGVRLLRNEMQTGNWIKIRLRSRIGVAGETLGRGDGARLIAGVGGAVLRRTVSGASYLSQSSRTVHFGLGEATRIDRLEIRWPDGTSSSFEGLEAGTTWELEQGRTNPVSADRGRSEERTAETGLTEREQLSLFWERQRAAMDALKIDGDCGKAVPLFRQALEVKPKHEDARYYLATCLAESGETAEAITQLETLIDVQPQSHRAHKQLGILQAMRASSPSELERATISLERALRINPEETGTLLVLGEIDLLLGELESAEERLSWVCRTNPRAVGAFYLRAYTAWRDRDNERSRTLLARVREARGEDWVPTGMTSEGDVRNRMHTESTLLSRFSMSWDGNDDLDRAFAELDAYVRSKQR
jgi:tetratricopeptide (TPR) repeat protein